MGFSQQINEIIRRLPDSRQTVMFSATLPGLLVDFAKAGLTDPVLIRLDVDTKIPEALELRFIFSRSDERYATLLVLMKHFIPSNAQTIIFAATQHHVELISLILTTANISNTYVYSNLDPSARKINTAKFAHNKVNVLVVTDIGKLIKLIFPLKLFQWLFSCSKEFEKVSFSSVFVTKFKF
jgi:ATP-dependent RNA helicase DDX54/DBP10